MLEQPAEARQTVPQAALQAARVLFRTIPADLNWTRLCSLFSHQINMLDFTSYWLGNR